MKLCLVDGCNSKHKAKGYCNTHYTRWKRNGSLEYVEERHGMASSPEYKTWRAMKSRCLNQNNPAFERYGEVGITVCDEWMESFQKFYDDMGERPKGMTLDRIDNSKGYYKENCRWATGTQQNKNRSISKNNKSGKTGVRWCRFSKKWIAQITVERKLIILEKTSDLNKAIEARLKAEIKYEFYKDI